MLFEIKTLFVYLISSTIAELQYLSSNVINSAVIKDMSDFAAVSKLSYGLLSNCEV